MKLSLADKLGLIYTSAGSQRSVAAIVGISHQTVGRILHAAQQGKSISAYESRDGLSSAVNSAYALHVDVSKSQARVDKLPFRSEIPIYSARMITKDGDKGNRVSAPHTHWLSDRLRNAWISSIQKTSFYHDVVVRSKVNLRVYNKQAQLRADKKPLGPTVDQIRAKIQLRAEQNAGAIIKDIYTARTPMSANFPSDLVLADINQKLQQRHAPATGDARTEFANAIYLQIDTRKVKNAANTRKKKRAKATRGSVSRKR